MVAGNDDDVVALLRAVVGDGFIDEPMVAGNEPMVAGNDVDDVDDGTGSGFLGIS